MGYKEISLPLGNTWKSYTEFLLETLPGKTKDIYNRKFATSFTYWLEKGGVLPVRIIDELQKQGIKLKRLGKPQNKRKYSTEFEMVKFLEYPDDIDIKDFWQVPSCKRMCVTILKNGTSCVYMGFSQTKNELQKQKKAMEEWKTLCEHCVQGHPRAQGENPGQQL